jgi:glycosyltransferase involved in cell wall biosynthesis
VKVVYFGSYDDRVSPRVRLLRDGLRRAGVEVVECRGHGRALLRYARLLRDLPAAARGADLILVAKPGQREMPLAAAFARAWRMPVAFDCFASLWLNEVLERRRVAPGSFAAWKLRGLDRFALRHADVGLVDTLAHGRLIAQSLGLDGRGVAPLRRVFVGAEELFRPLSRPDSNRVAGSPLEALFVGTFIPFHGIDVILRAAARLRDLKELRFTLLGDGQTRGRMEALAAALRLENVRFEPELAYAALPARIARADLCLGLFADSPTAQAVIPKKVFAALACARAVVTADSPGIREALDESTAFLCAAGSAEALAETLRRAAGDARERAAVAERGRALHERLFTADAIGASCRDVVAEFAGAKRAAPRERSEAAS